MSNRFLSEVTFDPARRTTPAREKATPGQVKSDQGGYVFKSSSMERARRFLILGSEDTFYKAGGKNSLENATTIRKIAKQDRVFELIDLIVDVSVHGRAPSQAPALFALALVIAETEDPKAKAYAFQQLSKVARTASTMFEFLGYLGQFKNLGGSGLKKAIGRWYNEMSVDKLAYQMVKYRQRGGFDHSRALRISKYVKSSERPSVSPLLDWTLGKDVPFEELPRIVQGFKAAQTAHGDHDVIVREYGLSWEMLPTEVLNNVKVWDALLDGNVPLGALIRQLPRLTKLGIISDLGGRTAEIEDRLTDREALRKARIHPVKALIAMRTYGQGYGESSSWSPVRRIVGALEESFYGSFEVVEPTGKSHYLAIDVSQSMEGPYRISDKVPLAPREIAAVMAMVVARTEREHYLGAFQDECVQLNITARDSLETVMRETGRWPFRGTNLSLPMMDALNRGMKVDAFVLYTDNEQGLGYIHPFQALDRYRRHMNIPAKIIINAVTATRFSLAEPNDQNALDIAGFDTNAPSLIAEFVR